MLMDMMVKDAKPTMEGGMVVSGIVIDAARNGIHVYLRFSQDEWDKLMAILILRGLMQVKAEGGE